MKRRNTSRLAWALISLGLLLAAGLLQPRGERRKAGDAAAKPSAPPPAVVRGRVVSVADGDSLEIRTADRRRVAVRLFGIDAPEAGQAFGRQARAALGREVQGRDVEIRVVETDKYGRLVGDLYLEGKWINEEQVSQGWAWHYVRYSDQVALARAERAARAARRGLWRDEHPVPPWFWRRQHPRSDAR